MYRSIIFVCLLAMCCAGDALAQENKADYGLRVAESGLGEDVVDRVLQGPGEEFEVGKRVYLWCRLVGGAAGDVVNHVWFYNGEEIQDIALPVGGDSWRTWSYKTLFSGMTGDWRVDILDESGQLLASHAFLAVE